MYYSFEGIFKIFFSKIKRYEYYYNIRDMKYVEKRKQYNNPEINYICTRILFLSLST